MGTMYNYVRSKEDILYIVYDFMTTILTEGLTKTIDDTMDPREKVSAALRPNMEPIYQYRDVIMFLYREAGNYDRESVHNVLGQETNTSRSSRISCASDSPAGRSTRPA